MKKINIIVPLLAAGLMIGTAAIAADYSSYTTEELSAMRGTLRNASAEERNAFRQEWQSRMQQNSSAAQGSAMKMQNQHKNQYRYMHKNASGTQSGAGNMYGSGGGAGVAGGGGGGHRYGGGGHGYHGGRR